MKTDADLATAHLCFGTRRTYAPKSLGKAAWTIILKTND
jgi:hypothetical protein